MSETFRLRPDSWEPPVYASDNEEVWLPLERADEFHVRVARCHIITAMGDTVRLYELPFGTSGWRKLSELLVPPHDPRHPRHPNAAIEEETTSESED